MSETETKLPWLTEHEDKEFHRAITSGDAEMSDRPIEELKAGDDFRRSVVSKADSNFSGAPLWHGWVIMDALLAGIDWARARDKKP